MEINIPVSVGELLDKLSIVEIKIKNISDKQKLDYLNKEFELLTNKAAEIKKIDSVQYNNFYSSLLSTNSDLWDIEDEIRELENKKSFEKDFIAAARAVYITNDERFNIKTQINTFFGSSIVEQKELKKY